MTGTIVQKYINALYVVMYDRAADSNGYNYWLSTVGGASAAQTPITDAIAQTMAGSFRTASSSYFNTQYAALSDSDFILELYENLGGNSSGVGGDALNYWQGRLDSFGGDRAKLAGDITKAFLEYNGTDADGLLRKQAFENKVAVSQAWVDASRTNAFMNAAATTDPAFAAETRVLNGIDHTTASLNLALAQVNSVVATRDLARATGIDVAPGTPTYALAAGAASVDEGGTATFTLTTTNVAAGSEFAYTLSGVGAEDVVGGQLSGIVTIGADGRAVIQVRLADDGTVLEGAETLTVTVAGRTASAVVNDTSSVPGQTFTLTSGIDSFTGRGGNDTFNAYDLNDVVNTLGSTDVLNGGAGTDTLDVYVTVAADNLTPSLMAIENINVTADATTVFNLSQSSGYTTLANVNSSAAMTFNNINSTTVALKVQDHGSATTTFAFAAAAVAGSADSATLTLENAVASPVTIAGVETLNIVSTGSANSAALTTANAASYVVTGDQDLSLGTLDAAVATLNASALTGALTATGAFVSGTNITGGSGADALTGAGANDTISGGAGNDSITAGAGSDSINGGAGDDRVTFATVSDLTTADTVVGGDGTDTLVATSADMTGTYTRISGFERLQVSDALAAALTTANVQAGIERVNLAASTGGQTITFEAGAKTLALGAAAGGAITVSNTGTAINDGLTILNTSAGTDVLDGRALTLTGFESVTIDSSTTTTRVTQDLGAITVNSTDGGAVAINFLGNNSVTTGVITASSGAVSGTVNASGLTGTASFTNVGAAVRITSITGSSNNDTIVGQASANTTIDGGAGNDVITGGTGNDNIVAGTGNDTVDAAAGNDSVNAGDGNDSITSGTGNDTLVGGAGNDTFVFGDNFITGDSVDGGEGTDTISVTNAALTTIGAYTVSVANALNDRVSGVERFSISSALDQTSFDLARLDSVNHITLAAGFAGNEELIALANGGTVVVQAAPSSASDILTLTLGSNTSASDALTVNYQAAASTDFGVLSVAGVETINLVFDEVDASTTVRSQTLGLTISRSDTASTTRAVTLNVTGTEAVTFDTAVSADVVNASGLTGGGLNMSLGLGSGFVQTVTGSAFADTLQGGAGVDVIDGGAGNDSLTGGAGADSITGGLGADVITGGAGNDRVVLTETAASVDNVVLDYSRQGGDIDVVVGFATGSSGDEFQLSLAALEAVGTSGIHTAAANFVLLGAAAATSTAAGAAVVQSFTGAGTVNTTASVVVLRGSSLSSTSDVEDALEAGGAFELTIDLDADVANNAFLVVYTDGTNAYVASARINSVGTADTDFEAGNLVVSNLAVIDGVTTIGSTTFGAVNFEWIA